MQKMLTLCAALLIGAAPLFAQNKTPYDPTGKFYVSVQGGPMYSRNENSFVYEYFDKAGGLYTWQASGSFGYDFTRAFGLRANVGYGINPGCANHDDTNVGFVDPTSKDDRFFPYKFRSLTYFVDAILHLNGINDVRSSFDPKLYAGIGGAHTWGFEATADNLYAAKHPGLIHPWQATYSWPIIKDPNEVIGFRLGAIAEYTFGCGLGLYADLCGEAFTDNFNGLMPQEGDFDAFHGYAGFPFDLRISLSLGLSYHF